ncbi:MAG: AAA family ATPase, partial [Alphaproteobacteria bacterium]|nr:AAA family ATPase [Alphaproteobacteria bacterium]
MTARTPPPVRDGQDAWEKVRARLLAEVGQATFASWLVPLTLVDVDGDQVTLGVGTRFLRDWVVSRFAHRIASLWSEERQGVLSVRIVIHAGQPAAGEGEPRADGEPAPARRGSAHGRARDGVLADLGSPLNGRFTFREFVVGETNELAHAAAQQVAGVDHLPFNPLYLYGGVGLGKTHLLHAIAWCIRGREPGRRVVYLSAERFMYQFVQAIRRKDTVAFKERFRSADVLLIDDIQFICDKDSTQEEFLHTLDALLDHRCQV